MSILRAGGVQFSFLASRFRRISPRLCGDNVLLARSVEGIMGCFVDCQNLARFLEVFVPFSKSFPSKSRNWVEYECSPRRLRIDYDVVFLVEFVRSGRI